MNFLKRRISATVWELLILLVVAIVFAAVYRIYFSRAVALTQLWPRQSGFACPACSLSPSWHVLPRPFYGLARPLPPSEVLTALAGGESYVASSGAARSLPGH